MATLVVLQKIWDLGIMWSLHDITEDRVLGRILVTVADFVPFNQCIALLVTF